ncbi:MAG: beta-ketoacyl-ACP synthase II [Vallitaleaceae bacterium]|jgi:3-oxoacyl-[acyl-carrier-protein] synthase II|nr:beta-ketoacyl-ACP synthase II [Vallitaleaceae bacterium]
MSRRVVVTGMGALTPLGNNVPDSWQAIKENKCGIGMIDQFDTTDYEVKVAASLKDYDPKNHFDRKEYKRLAKFSQLAIIAAREALADSGLNLETEDLERMGVIIGSGVGCLSTIEEEHTKLLERGPSRVSPLMVPKFIANMAAGNVSIELGAKGTCTSVVTACSSAGHSIGDAYRSIQYGSDDIIFAGGSESCITPLGVAGFSSLTALSLSTDPMNASKPFDKNRDGFVMGEGAGILVLEELEHALARGARIYAEVGGYGATGDAYHITSPAPGGDGGSRAMKRAIADAGLTPEDVSYINAHGTSTEYNDSIETEAIKLCFGEKAYQVPISSTKSMVGHLLGAAGAVESIVCIKAIGDSYIPATIGYETPDVACDLDYVPNVGREAVVDVAISNSLGFGGHNVTLLFKKYK